jgi:hypothetical protein
MLRSNASRNVSAAERMSQMVARRMLRGRIGMAIPLPRCEITEARPTLLGLAACLRAERPVYAREMALLSWLLADGAGPAYSSHARSLLFAAPGRATTPWCSPRSCATRRTVASTRG